MLMSSCLLVTANGDTANGTLKEFNPGVSTLSVFPSVVAAMISLVCGNVVGD